MTTAANRVTVDRNAVHMNTGPRDPQGDRAAACRSDPPADRTRSLRAGPGLVALAAVLAILAPGDADAAPRQPPRLITTDAARERAPVCGRMRTVTIVPVGSRAVAVVGGSGPRRLTLIVERCIGNRWSRVAMRRMARGRTGHRARLDTRSEGDYRLRVRDGTARYRPVHLRVGRGEFRTRRDVADLAPGERSDFVDAVLALKSTRSPYDSTLSYYDQFVVWHQELSRCDPADPLLRDMQMAHLGPMFLPWHRQFVVLFERALGEVSGKAIAVPYWDWTDPDSTRAVFSEDLMGGDGDPGERYAVTTGPFRKGRWELRVRPIGFQWASSATSYITRRFGSFPDSRLPGREDVRSASAAPVYDVPPFGTESDTARSFRNALEGFTPPLSAPTVCGPDGVVAEAARPPYELHNAVHLWVGGLLPPEEDGAEVGTMVNTTISPGDPVFFLHHAMVDRVWARWQQVHGLDTYEPRSGYPRNNVDDVMRPFEEDGIRVTPADVADTRDLGYRYGSRGRRETSPALPPDPSFQCGLAR